MECESFTEILRDEYDVPREAIYDFVYLLEKGIFQKINHVYLEARLVDSYDIKYFRGKVLYEQRQMSCSHALTCFIKDVINEIKLKKNLSVPGDIVSTRKINQYKIGGIFRPNGMGFVFLGEISLDPENDLAIEYCDDTYVFRINLRRHV